MALLSQQILNILGGVSQAPDKLRASSQMESQVNVYDSVTFGKIKRPPMTDVAKLASGTWATPFIHAVDRDAADKYHVVIAGGQCYVFDGVTGAQYQVLTPQGSSYLTGVAPAPTTQYQTDTDTFTGTGGTLLGSHTADTGQTWSIPTALLFNGLVSVNETVLSSLVAPWSPGIVFPRPASFGGSYGGYFFNQTMTYADYTASISATARGFAESSEAVIGLRCVDNISTNYVSGYFLTVPGPFNFSSNWTITKVNSAGTPTTLANFASPITSWGASSSHTITFSVQANVLTAYLDGVLVQTVMDGTYTAAGLPMLIGYDNGGPSTPSGVWQNWSVQYIVSVSTPPPAASTFRFCTVQDTTFIVNQTVTVEPNRAQFSPVRNPEALITLALADYATNYYVTINGVTVGFQSPAPTAPQSRVQLSTDLMASTLYGLLSGTALLSGFTFELLGEIGTAQGASTIYVTQNNGADFTISANDGLNDAGIVVVKGSVQNIAALPARALNNMVVTVQPDPQNNVDVAYYIYDNLGSPNLGGVWRESVAPGILTNIDNTTMPWQLTRSGDVLAGYPADGPPPLPTITFGIPSDLSHPVPNQLSSGTPYVANTRGSGVPGLQTQGTLDFWLPTLTGAPTTLVFNYDVDFGNLPTGEYAEIILTDVHAGTFTTAFWLGGSSQTNAQLTVVTTSPSNSEFTWNLTFSTGSNPTGSQVSSGIVLHGFGTDPITPALTGISLQVPTAVQLTWNEAWTYAGLVPIVVTITGPGAQTYTPAADETADQIATGVAALTFSGYTGTASGNVTTFQKSSGSPGATTVAYTWNNAEQYHNADLQLAGNELVGYMFMDLTDGSSGTVASNTPTTVTLTGALSGGITNAFRKGDLVAVTAPSGRLFFVLQPCNWAPRGAGDDVTNPFPGFMYNTIAEVGFTSGRLCLFSGENIICSGSDDVFNVFRTTVTSLLDADPINISANSDTVSDWHSMVHWAEGVWLFAGNVQAQLPTEPALSNSTVSIQPLTKYQSQPTLRPLAMDRRIYFARLRSPNSAQPVTEILRYQRIRFPFQGFIAEQATKPIPTYLAGTPLALVGDPVVEIMVVLTSAVPNQMYPYIYHYSENQEIQMESWSTWEIDPGATILALDFLDGVMGMIIQRADGVYFEQMDLQFALYEQQ